MHAQNRKVKETCSLMVTILKYWTKVHPLTKSEAIVRANENEPAAARCVQTAALPNLIIPHLFVKSVRFFAAERKCRR